MDKSLQIRIVPDRQGTWVRVGRNLPTTAFFVSINKGQPEGAICGGEYKFKQIQPDPLVLWIWLPEFEELEMDAEYYLR